MEGGPECEREGWGYGERREREGGREGGKKMECKATDSNRGRKKKRKTFSLLWKSK
jgi:hypothetical protein